MSSLTERLFGLFRDKAAFSRLELAILNAVQERLLPSSRELWVKQLQAVNRIHRSPDYKEVNLFVIRKGKAEFPRELMFNSGADFKIAVVDLEAKKTGARLRARVWCVNGHVFSIVYKGPSKDFEHAAHGDWEMTCQILHQPM